MIEKNMRFPLILGLPKDRLTTYQTGLLRMACKIHEELDKKQLI